MNEFQKRRWMRSLPRDFAGNQFPDLQREIAEWARETFPNTPEPAIFNKLRTEVLELAKARHEYWLASDKGEHPEDADPQEIAREAADVMSMMFQIAEVFEFDLLEETRKKFEANKQRTWQRQPDGTYQHTT